MFCNDHKCSCDRNELIDPMDTVSVIRRRVCKYMSIIMSCCHPSSSYKTACSDNNIFAESVRIECASKYKCFRNGLNVVHTLCISVSHVVRNAQLFPDLEFRILHKNRMHFCWYTQKQINMVTMHKAQYNVNCLYILTLRSTWTHWLFMATHNRKFFFCAHANVGVIGIHCNTIYQAYGIFQDAK